MSGYEITMNGKTKSFAGWCKEHNISVSTVNSRIKRGMTFEEALTKPVQPGHNRLSPSREGVKAPKFLPGYKAKSDSRCRRCYFGEKTGSHYVCMYMDLNPEHKRRGCEAGPKCTKWRRRSKRTTEAQMRFIM